MSEIKKLTKEELDSIKSLQTDYNKLVFELGSVESQLLMLNRQIVILDGEKPKLIDKMDKIGEKEKSLVKDLQDKYGAGNINIETGEITAF